MRIYRQKIDLDQSGWLADHLSFAMKESVMTAILEKIHRWVNEGRDAAYLAGQGRAAPDLPIDRADARRLLNSRADVRERMTDMAGRFGLTAADIDQDWGTALEVSLACGACRSEKTCRKYLEGSSDAYPSEFCPNAAIYADLAAMKG
jgi:hypothetical protein